MRLGICGSIPPYIDHLEPVFKALGDEERGRFLTTPAEREYLRARGLDEPGDAAGIEDTWLVASFRDLNVIERRRPAPGAIAFMEHGVGLCWYRRRHLRRLATATVICAPNEYWAAFYRRSVPTPVAVVGTPKMDDLARIPREADGRTVALSFHWTGIRRAPIPPPERFRGAIRRLAARRDVTVLGHGHPSARAYHERFWGELGIEYVPDFRDVVRRADVYACDVSSTIYEAAALGLGIVLLEHPDGPRSFHRPPSGLRYDEHATIGPHATPDELLPAVDRALAGEGEAERRQATQELYPYWGRSTARLLEVLRSLPTDVPQRALAELELEPDLWCVTNKTSSRIERGELVFEPYSTVEIHLSGYRLREIRACRYLTVWQ